MRKYTQITGGGRWKSDQQRGSYIEDKLGKLDHLELAYLDLKRGQVKSIEVRVPPSTI